MHDIPISLIFPVYRDETTVAIVAEKALRLLADVGAPGSREILIVDDASPDRSGAIADELAREHEEIRVIHHPENLGYGRALRSGIDAARFDFVCMTDGDDEYEVEDFRKLLKLRDHYDLIVTFRYKRVYSNTRIFVSRVYNLLLRFLFRTRFRDISTGLRVARKSVLDDIDLVSTSPFLGAEMTIKAMLKGYRVGEVGIQTFPRTLGSGSTVTPRNILATMGDMRRVYQTVFSEDYELPTTRRRD